MLERLSEILQTAPQSGTWPKCLRCCCCRTKTRTSCCGFKTTILFGQIKQLGIILKTQFNAEHYWIRTDDGAKLDCMFFRQARKHKKTLESDDSCRSSVIEERERRLDLIRPCFIICNSNAMFY